MNKQKGKYMRSIHMASAMLTFNPGTTERIFRVGDVIQFYPQIDIDYCTSSIQEEPCLQHVIYDIYKFRFSPIAKYSNNEHRSIYKNCYHYLIEIFPDFRLFCFNWTKPYKSYLKIGKWYEGHGQLRNCGNASECNEKISPLIMNNIFRTGKLTSIYENLLWRDYGNDMEPRVNLFRYSKNGYSYGDVLNGFGYSKNLDEFITNISACKERYIAYNSTEELPECSNIIFCVDILN